MDDLYIWRLETGDGCGPYEADMCEGACEGKYHGPCHPAPSDDGIARPYGLFGFGSILHARRWFSSIHDLSDWEKQFDAKLVVYRKADVHDIKEGWSQLTFNPMRPSTSTHAPKVNLAASDLHRLRVSELVSKVEEAFATCSESVHST